VDPEPMTGHPSHCEFWLNGDARVAIVTRSFECSHRIR
jgi:hypothetical protein